MTTNPNEQTPEPSDLEVAIRVARRMLDRYGTVDSGSVYAYTVAHGGLVESLRLLLRALDAEPDVTSSSGGGGERCPAAHPDDPAPCGGPVVVTVLDAGNAGANGCEHHGARLLASLEGGRVYPLPDAPEAAALRVFHAADRTRPFPWINSPRTRPEQLSRAENRCEKCRWTFDPYDKRFDGHARHKDSPWCRRCIDNCHDGGAEHVCVICDPARYGGEPR